ncbi:MAG: fumarylacetoacetate hydrolase family protein [Clostridiales bacterium]|nr:fumarylacetoacetate hydrolase family protein [Clostridiales bacterium]
MKLITYRINKKEFVGIVSGDLKQVTPIQALGFPYVSMNELIEKASPEELVSLAAAADQTTPETLPYADIELLAPIPVPKQDILCLGVNYMEHAYESARYKKEDFNGERPYPVYFCKRVNECTPDGGIIDGHWDIQERLDYEVELAVIIGKDARNVKKEDSYDYIFGYTIVNDVSSRDLQTRHKQFYFGKSLDTFTCMGPWIVTKDEISSFPPSLDIMSKINGELRQNSNTSNMIFDIPYIIEELSAGLTLKAGTVIATGTPSGVGMGFTPPKWMKHGDVVECCIEKIGVLKNKVE